MNNTDISTADSPSTALKLDFLFKEALIIILCVALLKLGTIGCLVVGAALLIWSLRGSKAAMQSLSLLILLSFLNPFFSPAAFPGSLKWLIIFVSTASALYHNRRNSVEAFSTPIPRWLLTFIFFFVICFLLSLSSSNNPEISIFKLITFAIGVFGCMAIFSDRLLSLRYALSWLYTMHVVVLLVSFPMIMVSIGYYPRTDFFMGMLNQSQSYGIYVVPFTTLLLMKWIIDRSSTSLLEKGACLIGIITLYLSNSRTSVGAFLIALVLLLLTGFVRKTFKGDILARIAIPAVLLILLLVSTDIITQGSVQRRLQSFIMKRGDTVESVLATREVKFEDAYHTFSDKPMTGVGFGKEVSTEDIQPVQRDQLLGLPVSAPVEAGVIYMALPAQIGIIGLIPFLWFFLYLIKPIFRNAPLPIFGLVLSGFLTNFGEYTFFAIGGLGLFYWIFVAFAHRFSVQYGAVVDY